MNILKSLRFAITFAAIALLAVCCKTKKEAQIFTPAELAIINDTLQPIMKIYLVTDSSGSTLLRQHTLELSNEEIKSQAYRTLCERMVKTVTDSTVDGVGIAGPQVGISRRVVAVQRYDKEGYPFEVYANIYIKEYSQQTEPGREGCLSVPAESLTDTQSTGKVVRSEWVIVSYTDAQTLQTV
ncbi:MAG: peptide deformylase, partial [Bacteroidales bacterium]|nr:peptide deformylase [Bacteroidales bacterium]